MHRTSHVMYEAPIGECSIRYLPDEAIGEVKVFVSQPFRTISLDHGTGRREKLGSLGELF